MRFGIHLPQYGRASGPSQIQQAAVQAEELGFHDVWVYDHIAVPANLSYPAAYVYEPLITLTWAGSVTHKVGLGTSILVLPYRRAVYLAKALASLDRLSDGRLVVGASSGWLQEEFNALGVSYEDRGHLTDETIQVLRAAWSDSHPTSFSGLTVQFKNMKILPKPGRRIPIWVGGTSERAIRRAVEYGDGWHGALLEPTEVWPVAKALRASRPEPEFTLSMRLEWDGLDNEAPMLRDQLEEYAAAGVQHIMAAPAQRTTDNWLRSVDRLWRVFEDFADPQ